MGAVVERDLGAGDRTHVESLRGMPELERAVDAVVIGKGEGLIPELGGLDDELFRKRGAVEERIG